MTKLFYIFLLFSGMICAQTNQQTVVTGYIRDAETQAPYSRVNIELQNGDYTTTNIEGYFKIDANVGDVLTIRHEDFQTIYHTVNYNDELRINVQPENQDKPVRRRTAQDLLENYRRYLDSARISLRQDAKLSIEYVAKALEIDKQHPLTRLQKGESYELLGDIYTFWKQFDLAVTNYKLSIRNTSSIDRNLKLAAAHRDNNSYQESITLYEGLKKPSLSDSQNVRRLEGLGDTYMKTNATDKAIVFYQDALSIAEATNATEKVTDLNSKIAEAYETKGANEPAASYYENALNLASGLDAKRAAEEKNKVADFFSRNQAFDEEIELREDALKDIQSIKVEEDEDPENESALTPQKQNFKIARAYAAKRDYDKSIVYLNESIKEASTKNDLTVQKDATRKLGEVYREKGELKKAENAFKDYEVIVDKLYIKKEQEITQAARFSRDLSVKQTRIESLEKDRELNESRYRLALENQNLVSESNNRQKYIIWVLVALAITLIIAAYYMFRNNKQQKFANNLLALKSLRSQMNPHFIFNALNSVNSFIATNDERAANRYLSEFSGLMRGVLENSEEDFIPLSKEIEQLQRYIKLEHFRFQDKFDYTVNIDSAIPTDEFLIPPMLLQPYVENAVWHGLRYKKTKGQLSVNFNLIAQDRVSICIVDDGIGRKKSKAIKTKHQKQQKSQGMSNIKRRVQILNAMYDEKVGISIEDVNLEGTGTQVEVILKK